MLDQDVIAVIGKYLKQIDSCIAETFSQMFDYEDVDFSLEDVVKSRWDVMVNSVVYNHLKLTAPVTAAEFRANHKFTVSSQSFQDFVRELLSRYHCSKERVTSVRVYKPMRPNARVKVFFTPEEDARILAGCSTPARGQFSKVAKELGRNTKCIYNRYHKLQKGIKQFRRRFNQGDDQVILDAVIEHLPGKRLVDVSSSCKWREIGDSLNRDRNSVLVRWTRSLLPTLLQHYSGTLNLRVEMMLANHVADTYKDFHSIDWMEVAARAEFSGHTLAHLKNYVYLNMKKNARIKLRIKSEEMNPEMVRDYARNVYGDGLDVKVRRKDHRNETIEYFQQKVAHLDLSNFL